MEKRPVMSNFQNSVLESTEMAIGEEYWQTACYPHKQQSRGRFVCLSVCFSHDVSKNDAAIEPLNLTQKCSTISRENPFILGSKYQR